MLFRGLVSRSERKGYGDEALIHRPDTLCPVVFLSVQFVTVLRQIDDNAVDCFVENAVDKIVESHNQLPFVAQSVTFRRTNGYLYRTFGYLYRTIGCI